MNLEGQTLGHYEFGPVLGRGGMGTVYRGRTSLDSDAGPAGTTVALKVFHQEMVEDERSFARFQREAEIGIQIRHPNVVRTYEMAQAQSNGDAVHFMVMEFIEGQTLSGLLKELGTFPEHLVFQVADQALDALQAIHDRGIVHRDIKPENIVITAEHRVLLMDLGVARLEGDAYALTRSGEFVGSIPYAAPEQFMHQDQVGPRSDLYSFGVVMYEIATGKNPFVANDLAAILNLKLTGDIRRPREALPELAPFLDEVIATCLRQDPSDRFPGSAELRAILGDGERSTWWKDQTGGVSQPGAERALRRLRVAREAPLIGRGEELDRLFELWREVQGAGGRHCLVAGATGMGKSRLVYNFVEGLGAADGPLILAGRCAGSGGRSYQPFIEALEDLLCIDDLEPEDRRGALEAKLTDLLADTPGVVSPLAEFLLGGAQPGGDGGLTKDGLLAACANILRNSARERPLILVIEDLHMAGPDTTELLSYLGRLLEGQRIFLITLHRDDEVEEGSPFQEWLGDARRQKGAHDLELGPLSRALTEELLRQVVRKEGTVRNLGRIAHQKSGGNPYVLFEVLTHLREEGVLKVSDEGASLAGPLDAIALPSTVRDLLSLKLARLDDEQRETLEAAAILGNEFSASLLAKVLEEKRIRLLKRLAILERKFRFLQSSGRDSFHFINASLRDAIYGDINEDLRTEYHSVVADTLLERAEEEQEEGEEVSAELSFQLTHHMLEGERAEESVQYVPLALTYLAGHYHASGATPILEKLQEALASGDAHSRTIFDIQAKLWEFYEMQGREQDQLRVIESARALAADFEDPGTEAQVCVRHAATLWRKGDFPAAEAAARKGMELARQGDNRRWEANGLHALGAIAWRRGDYHEGAAKWKEALGIRREIGDRQGEARSLQALGVILPEIGEGDQVLPHLQNALEIFREFGDRKGECNVLNNIGNALMDSEKAEEALEQYKAAGAITRETGLLITEAIQMSNQARALRALGRAEECKAMYGRALELAHELGERNMEQAFRIQFGEALTVFGEYAEARRQLERGLAEAEAAGARAVVAQGHRLLGGVLHRAGEQVSGRSHLEAALEIAEDLKIPTELAACKEALANATLEEGNAAEAVELFQEALEAGGDLQDAGSDRILTLCRYARALEKADRLDEAYERGLEAERLVNAREAVSPEFGPEIYYSLGKVLGGEDRGKRYLTTARELIHAQTRSIREDALRDTIMNKTWPNKEILEEARRVLDR